METWTLKQATLLLHGMDPNQHRSLKPYMKDLPPEYSPLQKTYLVLQQFPWNDFYPDYFYWGKGIHPIAVIYLAIQKKLPLSKRLRKLVVQRFYRENRMEGRHREMRKVLDPYVPPLKPAPTKIVQRTFGFTARERKNLLRSLGIVVRLLFGDENTSPRYWYANQFNAYQAAQTILEKAQKIGISTKGLKSLDRKITEALALLEAGEDEEYP